jgi:hypothetical protein
MLVLASQMLLQLAVQDIGQLTDIEPGARAAVAMIAPSMIHGTSPPLAVVAMIA